MRKRSTEKGESGDIADINVTPMCDLSLTLLIILMVISPMIMQSMIKVFSSSAVASSTKAAKKEKPLFVDIREKDTYLNNRKVPSDLYLATHLLAELSRKADKSVMVTVHPAVLHGKVVHTLDLIKQNGAGKVSLIKRRKRK